MPRTPPTPVPDAPNDDPHRETKRQGDLRVIKDLFSVFPRPVVEWVLDEAAYDRIHVDHIDCLDSAERKFQSLLFHLYDSTLRRLLEEFFAQWDKAWDVGRMSHDDPLHRGVATLSLSETDPSGWDEHDKYCKHVGHARRSMAEFTKHVHEHFPEFDLAESDAEASKKYWEFVEDIERRVQELSGESKSDGDIKEPDSMDRTMSEDATREYLLKVEKLKEMLVSRATGGEPDQQLYVVLRRELVSIAPIRDALPDFVRKCGTIREFWNFIKPMFETDKYRQRTEYLQQEFLPILQALEGRRPLPDLSKTSADTAANDSKPRPDVVLVTVNEHETRAVIDGFKTVTGREPVVVSLDGRVYHDLGEINGTRVFHAISEMGSAGAGGMQQTVDKAIRSLEPGAVIAIGIAFGVDENDQSIGDVLLSKQLRLYELQRIGKGEIVLRGSLPDASTRLVNHFKAFAQAKWKGAKTNFGLMLTGEKLVDDVDYRAQLLAFEVEAIGGEMEGAGLYVSGTEHKVDWIVVKAICDFADGKKAENKDERQILAATSAVQFLIEALEYATLKRKH